MMTCRFTDRAISSVVQHGLFSIHLSKTYLKVVTEDARPIGRKGVVFGAANATLDPSLDDLFVFHNYFFVLHA